MNEVLNNLARAGASAVPWLENALQAGTGAMAADFSRVLQQQRDQQGRGTESAGKTEKPAPSAAEVAAARAAARQALHAQAVKEIKEYLEKSPAEHLREAVLREMGLSEGDLAKMAPDERKATEMEIGRRVREHLLGRKPKEGEDNLAALHAQLTPAASADATQGPAGSLILGTAAAGVARKA